MTIEKKTPTSREELVVAFQKFNDAVMAKVSSGTGRGTHAFGATRQIAQRNALRNYRLKYSLVIS